MAQDFRRHTAAPASANATTSVYTADSNDCIVGLHCANVAATQITVGVWVRLTGTTDDIYLIKDAPIPVGSSLSIDGKFNLASGDILRVTTDTANGLNLFVSLVDEISA